MFNDLILAARDEEEIDDFREYDEETEADSKLDEYSESEGDDDDEEEADAPAPAKSAHEPAPVMEEKGELVDRD